MTQAWTCMGKRRHRTKLAAERALAREHRRGRHDLKPYRCAACQHWHLGRAALDGGDAR